MKRLRKMLAGILVLASGVAVFMAPEWLPHFAEVDMTEQTTLRAGQVGGALGVLGGLLTLLGLYSRRA